MKKKGRKNKKRFKNRIVPDLGESNSISMISKVDELPPLRAHVDKVTNGQPSIHVSPNRMSNQNGMYFLIFFSFKFQFYVLIYF